MHKGESIEVLEPIATSLNPITAVAWSTAETIHFGGIEGPKMRISLDIAGKGSADYIAKELLNQKQAEETVRKYRYLESIGVSVPPEYYALHYRGRYYSLTTDLTERGKVPIWGVNYGISPLLNRNLVEIHPTAEEIHDSLAWQIDLLDQHGGSAGKDIWAIRRPRRNPLEAYALDVTHFELPGKNAGYQNNASGMELFIENTMEALRWFKK